MKKLILILSATLTLVSFANAQAVDDKELAEAYKLCEPHSKLNGNIRWEAGWEDCAKISEAYDLSKIKKAETEAKDKVKLLTKKLYQK